MDFPTSAEITAAATSITDAWNALSIFASLLAIVLIMRIGPRVLRMVKSAF